MKHRTHRLRRVAAALALGVGGVGGVIGIAAGTAGALTKATIKATSAPSIGSTGTSLAAGSLTITLPAGTAVAGTLSLKVQTAQTGTHVTWAAGTVSHSAGTTTPGAFGATTFTVAVTKAKTTADTIRITGIEYDTTGAHGTISVTPTLTGFKFNPLSVVNAKAPGAATVFFTGTKKLTATTNLPLANTGNGQVAGTWMVSLKGAATKGWSATQVIDVKLNVPGHTATNCTSLTHGYVVFTGTPTVKVAAMTKTSTTPTVTDYTAAASPCTGANHNELVVKFTNSGTLTANTGSVTLAISGVKYDVGGKVTMGRVNVSATYPGTSTQTASGTTANGYVTATYVTANTPAVTLKPSQYAGSISPVNVVENTVGTVSSGLVCMDLSSGTFNTAATATAKVTKGDGVVTKTDKVLYEKSTGAAATTTATAEYALFKLKTASTTTASTYQVSGLKVNAPSAPGPVTVAVWHGNATNCTTSTGTFGTAVAFTVGHTTTQIYGATADATAAAEFAYSFPHTGSGGSCPTTGIAVLATDQHFQDALTSAYLASALTTGTLLTPTAKLSSPTINALRVEGIKQVDVVGGSLAVSTTVVAQLETTPVYTCGGKTLTLIGGKEQYISVNRIAGYTQYGTANEVAKYIGTAPRMSIAGAYLGTNATKGTGKFNDTPAMGSAAPNLSGTIKTAILASGQEFQDAEAASALAYARTMPILLTPATSLSATAATAIRYLGVQQVILMGGTLAVTNTVVKTLETTLGVSVVRVAGKDATDTAVQLANFECATFTTGADFDPAGMVMVARGNGYTDGLAGAVIDANHTWPLLLTENPTTVGTYLTTFLKMAGKTGIDGTTSNKISSLTILGGPLAITPATIAQMQTDLQH